MASFCRSHACDCPRGPDRANYKHNEMCKPASQPLQYLYIEELHCEKIDICMHALYIDTLAVVKRAYLVHVKQYRDACMHELFCKSVQDPNLKHIAQS
jgi:hypothetical protein